MNEASPEMQGLWGANLLAIRRPWYVLLGVWRMISLSPCPKCEHLLGVVSHWCCPFCNVCVCWRYVE